MLSMSVMSNDNAPKSVYPMSKLRLLDDDGKAANQSHGSYDEFGEGRTESSFIGNSLFTRITNNMPSVNGTSNDEMCNLIEVYDAIKQPVQINTNVDTIDTKECHVVMPKLNKSLDVHLNKTKTINLKRLQLLVAKNIIKKDSVSLDVASTDTEPVRPSTPEESKNKHTLMPSDESFTLESHTEVPILRAKSVPTTDESENRILDFIQRVSECQGVLNQVVKKVSDEVAFTKESGTPAIDLNEQCQTPITTSSLEDDQNNIHDLVDKIVTDLSNDTESNTGIKLCNNDEKIGQEEEENIKGIESCDKPIFDDISSTSSDYASLKLSLDNDSEHEEIPDHTRTINLQDDHIENVESKHTFVLDWLDADRLPTPSPPPAADSQGNNDKMLECDISEEEFGIEEENKSRDDVISCTAERNDKEQEVADQTTNTVPGARLESNDISIDCEQKIKPLKLDLKEIQKANLEKILVKMTKKLFRLTLDEGQTSSTEQMSSCEEPNIVMYATVDNNCIIETVDFSDKSGKKVADNQLDERKASDVESDNTVVESKDAKEKCKNSKISLQVLETKVDEVSRKLQFDLEDAISFRKSAINLLSDEKRNGVKRRKPLKTTKVKQTKEDSSLVPDIIYLSPNTSSESSLESDKEFCPTESDLDSAEKPNTESNTRETRQSSETVVDETVVDKTLAYKKRLRKRQSFNFLDDMYSDDSDTPTESKRRRYIKQKPSPTEAPTKNPIAAMENIIEQQDNQVDDAIAPAKTNAQDAAAASGNTNEEPNIIKVDGLHKAGAQENDTAISSITHTCKMVAINPSSTAKKLSKAIKLARERCGITNGINQTIKPTTEDKNQSVINDCQPTSDTPLDLSKKVTVEQNLNAVTQHSSNKEPIALEKSISISITKVDAKKQAESKQIESITIEDNNNNDEKQKCSEIETIQRIIKKCAEETFQVNRIKQQDQLSSTPTPASSPQVNAFSFPNYNAELFQNEYQRLQKELAALDFVAQQKELERNNILQLKKHRLVAMQQLQLRKQLLQGQAKPQAKPQTANNVATSGTSIASVATTTTIAVIQPRVPTIMSTAGSVAYPSPNYPTITGPAAKLTTSTEVTSALRPNAVIIRPIVTKAAVSNGPIMPIRPKVKPIYNPKVVPPQPWPYSRLPVPNTDFCWHSINAVQTIITKANENIGIKWITDNRRMVMQPVTVSSAQSPSVNKEKLPSKSRPVTVIIPQSMSEGTRSPSNLTASKNLPFTYRHSTLAQLLTTNQNYDKVNNSPKLAPRWPSCHTCKNQTARYICAGCNKQWYCSEKCQIADWKTHFKTCKK